MGIPDRYAPWVLAVVLGVVAWKPIADTANAFATPGIVIFFGSAAVGFAAGVPFWLRGRRRNVPNRRLPSESHD